MNKTIEISDKTYTDLAELADTFETPESVISRLISNFNNRDSDLNLVQNGITVNGDGSARKITEKTIGSVFIVALDVFEKKIELLDAIKILENQENMHSGSARIYITNFQKMMAGELYQRAMNGFATRYFLEKIKIQKKTYFEGALKSVYEHIKYYESHSNGKLKNIRSIYDEFKKNES